MFRNSGMASCTRPGAFQNGVAHAAHLRLKLAKLEQRDRLRRLLHFVDRVIHRGDQVLDVAAIERGYEDPPHRLQHFARDRVGGCLMFENRLAVPRNLIASIEERAQSR